MFLALANFLIRHRALPGQRWLVLKALRRVRGKPVLSRYGVKMRVRNDWTNTLCITGLSPRDYDDVYHALDRLEPGMAFVDIGANAGLFSMVAGLRVGADGAVLAFEPSPEIFADLVDNSRLNELRNFYPFNAAVGDALGIARFSRPSPTHSGGAHLDPAGAMTVPVISFEVMMPLFEALIGERRTVIKIDVEGAEELVTSSIEKILSKRQVECCIVEIDNNHLSRFGHSAESIYRRMAAAGLTPEHGFDPSQHYNEVFVRA